MGVIIRQGGKAMILSYIGVVIGAFNVMWLMPKLLSAEVIGFFKLLIDMSFLIAPFASFGIGNIILKFHPYFSDNKEKEGEFLFVILTIPIIGFLIVGMLFFFFQNQIASLFLERSALFVDYMVYVLPMGIIVAYNVLLEHFSKTQLRVAVPRMLNDVVHRMFITAAIFIYYWFALEFSQLVLLYFLAYLIVLVGITFYINHLGKLNVRPSLHYFDKLMIREIFSYGSFIVMGSIAGIIVIKIDVIMISSMLGLTDTGIYSIAFYAGTLIEMPKRSLSHIASPIIGKALKKNKLEEVNTLYEKTAIIQLIVGAWLLMLLWFNIDAIFSFVPNNETYIAGKYVVLFVGLGKLIDMAFGVNREIINLSQYYKYNVLITGTLIIVAIGTNLLLIPKYGITGAAIATTISFLFYNIIRFLFLWFKFKMSPFSIKYGLTVLLITVVTTLSHFIPDLTWRIPDILLKTLIISSVFLGAVYTLKLSDDFNELVQKQIKRFL